MCGIAGILSSSPELKSMERMLKVMRHRGPEGTFYAFCNSHEQKALLGFLSLAFTDLSGGAQPMFNEEKTIAAVCNGEFYDYREIREELKKKGHVFRTQSDSEIAIHLYEEYGMEMFKHLNGEFAFAIYDSRINKLFMVRDRYGVKPLFFSKEGNEFRFASEAKSLLILQEKRSINPMYFNACGFGGIESTITPFMGISAVRPGHVAMWDGKSLTQKAYWQPQFDGSENLSYEECQKTLRSLALKGIERRIDTTIPIASTLSGGVDSTIVSGLVKKHFGKQIKAFTLGYKDTRFSESPTAKLTADHFGLELNRVELSSEDLIEHFLLAHYHSESIIKDFSGAARYLLNKAIKDSGHKAVLSGEGPDELMGGYAYFKLGQIWEHMLKGGEDEVTANKAYEQFRKDEKKSEGMLWQHVPDWRKYKDILGDPVGSAITLTKAQKFRKFVLSRDLANKLAGHSLFESFDSEFGLDYLRSINGFNKSRVLSKNFFACYIAPTLGDRSEMANSLEGRAPFLDLDVINFSLSLPAKYCFSPNTFQGKRMMYDAFSDIIPEHFKTITKQPFRSPTVRSTLKGKGGPELFATLMSREAIKKANIFNPNTVGLVKMGWKLRSEESSAFRRSDMDMGYFMSMQAIHHVFIERLDKFADLSDLQYPMIERSWNFV